MSGIEASQNMDNCQIKKSLGETDYSQGHHKQHHHTHTQLNHKTKKRVGPYIFNLNDVLGCGFSSIVYRAHLREDQNRIVAIKMMELGGMTPHRRKLLDNEVHILKKLRHPHIVAVEDIYFSANYCYVVMEYCQDGCLQQHITAKKNIPFGKVILEIGQALQYLSSQHILHRDIKPANVLIKKGMYKLADFGFACQLSQHSPIIKDTYLIGSPLYMAPQALAHNVYSAKGDAFSLGVFIYYLLAGRHPWRGKDKAQLIKAYHTHKFSDKHIALLPPKIKYMLKGLLQLNVEKRVSINECDFQAFSRLPPPRDPAVQLNVFKQDYSLQLKLCQYIHLLMQNYKKYQNINPFLFEFMKQHLTQLVELFNWHSQLSLAKIKKQYYLYEGQFNFGTDEHHWLNNCLKDTIKTMTQPQSRVPVGLLQKLLHYRQLVECLLYGESEQIRQLVESWQLHRCCQQLQPDSGLLNFLLSRIDFYEM